VGDPISEERKAQWNIDQDTADTLRRVFSTPDGVTALIQLLDWMGYFEMQPPGDGPLALNNLAKYLLSVIGINQPWNARALLSYGVSISGTVDPRKGYRILDEEEI
jgi:hypothetical protein